MLLLSRGHAKPRACRRRCTSGRRRVDVNFSGRARGGRGRLGEPHRVRGGCFIGDSRTNPLQQRVIHERFRPEDEVKKLPRGNKSIATRRVLLLFIAPRGHAHERFSTTTGGGLGGVLARRRCGFLGSSKVKGNAKTLVDGGSDRGRRRRRCGPAVGFRSDRNPLDWKYPFFSVWSSNSLITPE